MPMYTMMSTWQLSYNYIHCHVDRKRAPWGHTRRTNPPWSAGSIIFGYPWATLGTRGTYPRPCWISIGKNQLVDIGANTVLRRAHSVQRLRSNHAHITCQKLPVNENRAQGPPLRCQGSSSCTMACSCVKPWVARERKVEIAVRTRRYWPMTEPHAWTVSCARVAYCWAYTCKLLR